MGPGRSIWRFLAALQAVCVCFNGDKTTCSLFLLEDIVFPHVFPCWRILQRDPLAVLLCVQRAHVCACVPESWRSGKGETNIIRSVNHEKKQRKHLRERERQRVIDWTETNREGNQSRSWIFESALMLMLLPGKKHLKRRIPADTPKQLAHCNPDSFHWSGCWSVCLAAFTASCNASSSKKDEKKISFKDSQGACQY